jgi:hypothetical protein
MSKFALVSTVDTMGEGFPHHCVMLFDTREEAVASAVKIIEKHDDRVLENGYWYLGTEQYQSSEELLEAWQDGLTMMEFFHVMPVEKPGA